MRIYTLIALFLATLVPAPRQRVISTSPAITEILYGIGAFDRVVAVSDYDTYPPEVKNLPRVGKWEGTSLEAVVGLHADLVILADYQIPFLQAPLKSLGIPSLSVPGQTLADMYTAIARIGEATDHASQARELTASIQARLKRVQDKTRGLPRRRVLLIVDRTPGTLRGLYAATKGSFLAELLEMAGGECVGDPAKIGFIAISKEAVLALQPDAIIDFVHGSRGRMGEDPKLVWRDLPELRAVRDGHIYPLDNEFLPHASQFVGDTAELFARTLHPEAFK